MPIPAARAFARRATGGTYPGEAKQIGAARANLRALLEGCPMVNDVLLCASELATNAVLHSQSRLPGGTFTMRGKISPGAFCDEISTDPATGAGVAYVRLEAAPDPVRVRAAFVSDDDIRDMTATYTCGLWAEIPALTAGEAL